MRITIDEDDLNYIINNIEDRNIIEKLILEKEKWNNNIKSSKRTLAAEKATKYRENLVKNRLRITLYWFIKYGYMSIYKDESKVTTTKISEYSNVSYNTTKKYLTEIRQDQKDFYENLWINKVNYCELHHKVLYEITDLNLYTQRVLKELQGNDPYSTKYINSKEYKEAEKQNFKDINKFHKDLGFTFEKTNTKNSFFVPVS